MSKCNKCQNFFTKNINKSNESNMCPSCTYSVDYSSPIGSSVYMLSSDSEDSMEQLVQNR